MVHEQSCLFCRIVYGDIPNYTVYEDGDFLGFLDIRPLSKGHTLLIPKKHARWVHDVEPFGRYWEIARKVKNALDAALKPEWVQYFTHGVVPHAHIHILPRYDAVILAPTVPDSQEQPAEEDFKRLAERIRTLVE